MRPATAEEFPAHNMRLIAPPGMANCSDLLVHAYPESEGAPGGFISCWVPTAEERAAIAAGGPVWLSVCTNREAPPPVWATGTSPFVGDQPPCHATIQPPDAARLDGIAHAIGLLGKKLDQVLINQQRQEAAMATAQETISSLVGEVNLVHQEVSEVLATAHDAVVTLGGFPDRVVQAVAAAIAANPGADFTSLEGLSADLEGQRALLEQARVGLAQAISAVQPVATPAISTPTPTGEPFPLPETGSVS